MIALLAPPGFADPPSASSDVAAATSTDTMQTQALRQRLEFFRNSHIPVTLSFTGLLEAFNGHMSPMSLRLGACSYDVSNDISGLVDILLAANIKVGYPVGWEKYQPEARFGVYFGVDQPWELDLSFSNPLVFDPTDMIVVGQSHDIGEVTAYKIAAEGKLRDELWEWTRARGQRRPASDAWCRRIEKYYPSYPSPPFPSPKH